MKQPWKIILVLVGIFMAGMVTGVFAARQFGRDWFAHRSKPEQWELNHVKRITDRLDLSNEQAEQIRPIIRRNMNEMNQQRENMLTESKAITERMQREVSEQLTPDQRVRYEQINKELREKAKKLMQERAARPPGAGAGKPERERSPAESKSGKEPAKP